MKKNLAVIAIAMNSITASAQDTIGIRVNQMYQENAQGRNWSFYLSPPPFAGHTLRLELGRVMSGKARSIPPSFATFDIGIQKHVSEHLALGIQFQYGLASVTDALVYNNDINNYSLVSRLSVSSLNGILYGRYYYTLYNRSRWNSQRHPKEAKRLTKGYRKFVFFSGVGIGYGNIVYTPSTKGNFQYPEIPSLQDFVFGIEMLGVNYYINRHWGIFGGFSFGMSNSIYRLGHAGIFIHP